MPTVPPTDPTRTYADEVTILDAKLDEALMLIRRASDAGHLTAVEAADRRITVMAAHLNSVGLLRERYFGTDDPGGWISGSCRTE